MEICHLVVVDADVRSQEGDFGHAGSCFSRVAWATDQLAEDVEHSCGGPVQAWEIHAEEVVDVSPDHRTSGLEHNVLEQG